MKHIKIFEKFSYTVNEAGKGLDSCEFKFLTFDDYKGPLNFDTTDLDGLIKLSEQAETRGNAAEIGDAGVFICHIKQPGGGFTRLVTSVKESISPLTFEVTTWDGDLKLKSKDEEVPVEDIPLLISKGNILGRFI